MFIWPYKSILEIYKNGCLIKKYNANEQAFCLDNNYSFKMWKLAKVQPWLYEELKRSQYCFSDLLLEKCKIASSTINKVTSSQITTYYLKFQEILTPTQTVILSGQDR